MTTKVFKLVANVIRVNNKPFNSNQLFTPGQLAEKQLLEKIVSDFCAEFKRTNARFNKEKFLKACGV